MTCSHNLILKSGACYYCGADFSLGPCQGPSCSDPATQVVSSQTLYEWDGEGEDPNKDHKYCDRCARIYTEVMDEQWREYWGSKGISCT